MSRMWSAFFGRRRARDSVRDGRQAYDRWLLLSKLQSASNWLAVSRPSGSQTALARHRSRSDKHRLDETLEWALKAAGRVSLTRE